MFRFYDYTSEQTLDSGIPEKVLDRGGGGNVRQFQAGVCGQHSVCSSTGAVPLGQPITNIRLPIIWSSEKTKRSDRQVLSDLFSCLMQCGMISYLLHSAFSSRDHTF